MNAGVLAVMQASAHAAEKALLSAAGVEEGEMVPPDVADAITDLYIADESARATVAEVIRTSKKLAEAVAALEVKQSSKNANASFLDTRDVMWLRSLAIESNEALARAAGGQS